ncbi:MAG: IPT/TIG domain-containing protein [Caldimonas sp.]
MQRNSSAALVRSSWQIVSRPRFAMMLLLALAGCGGGGGSGSMPPPPPPPAAATIASIAPATVVAGSAAFTLTVNGTGFVSGAVVSVGASAMTTSFVSATQLTAVVPAAAVTTSGALAVTAVNPGSSASNALNLMVSAPPPVAPTLTSLSPSTLGAGSAAFVLTVNGTGFTSASRVSFNGTVLTTTFVSSTQLTAAAPALSAAATLPVLVVDGATSTSALNFEVTADAFPAIVSVTLGSTTFGGNRDSSVAAPDAQGRFIAFQSAATDLVAGDLGNGVFTSIYLRDTCVGAPASCTPSTRLVSLNPAGTQCVPPALGLGSMFPVISSDGRFVAFHSDACFPGVTGTLRQIVLRDTCVAASGTVSGCTASTTLISANIAGQPSNSGTSSLVSPALSRNGRYVAWSSSANDLFAGVATGGFLQVYLRDRCVTSTGPVAGCTAQTVLVSRTASGAANDETSQQFLAVSDNGIVVFRTSANNLIPHPLLMPGSGGAVFRADCSGGVSQCDFSIVSIVPGSGTSVTGVLLDSQIPTISPDGRFIAFLAQGENVTGSLVTTPPPNLPPPNLALPGRQVMLYDSCVATGAAVPACTPKFAYESVLDNGNLDITLASQANQQPSLSDDGRFVSFAVPYNLSALYPGAGSSVYVRDTCGGANAPAGCVPRIALVSLDRQRVPAGTVGWSRISGDGHFVVFYSLSRSPAGTSNLLPTGQVIMARTGF